MTTEHDIREQRRIEGGIRRMIDPTVSQNDIVLYVDGKNMLLPFSPEDFVSVPDFIRICTV
jgi:hypothetical protein